jgi:hypothetical protein
MEAESGQLVERAATEEDADWFVRVVEDRVILVPSSGWSRESWEDLAPASFSLGGLSSPDLTSRIPDALRAIAKATHLLGIASMAGPNQSNGVDVRIELVRFQDATDRLGEAVPYGPNGRTLTVGDLVAFRLTNPTTQTIDASLLFIDSSYGIQAVIPSPGTATDNRLRPGQSIQSETLRITSETLGPEQVVAIAVETPVMGPAVDFASFLTQPSLERTRGRAGDAANSPLGQLLQNAVFGVGTVRGSEPAGLGSYSMKLLAWRTVPR